MPLYKVKPEKDNYPSPVNVGGGKPKKRYPTVTVPASPELIAALEVGGPVTIELTGFVQGLESRQSTESDPWANRNEIRVELRTVEANPGDDMEEDAAEGETDDETMADAIDKGLGYKAKK